MENKPKLNKTIFNLNIRGLILILIDIFIVFLACLLTKFMYPEIGYRQCLLHVLLISVIFVFVFYLNGLTMALWRYASFDELNKLVWCSITVVAFYVGVAYLIWPIKEHFIFSLLFALVYAIGLITSRLTYCIYYRYRKDRIYCEKRRVAIIGGGYLGSTIIRSISLITNTNYDVVCIFDDNVQKLGRKLNGVKIIGTLDDIPERAKQLRIDDLIIAISNPDEIQRKRIFDICQQTECQIKKVPTLENLLTDDEAGISLKLENIKIEDLLGRDIVELDDEAVIESLKDKVVLVTGGGGSIGSEICRQISKCAIKQLIILDIYENNAYDIQQELLRKYKDNLDLKVEIASVRDNAKIEEIMQKYHPHIIYHAAAHKHVPLMEFNPEEAVKNNIFGTYNVAMSAHRNNVEKFVFISTDKAVNPTNVMGATKRFSEMIIQSMKDISKTIFTAVRFGNVLGSNGSVIPLFKRQIESGGPVTVTHPEIIRYFMVIPEAVKLVLTAGATAHNGTVFVLDMGNPVKISDLAKRMIKLAGYVPDKDIKIEYTGLRPGEKMYEELLVKHENITKTAHNKIFVENLEKVNSKKIESGILELKEVLALNDRDELINKLKKLVVTYNPNKNNESK